MVRNGTQFEERMNIVYVCVIKKVNNRRYLLLNLSHRFDIRFSLTIILDEIVR